MMTGRIERLADGVTLYLGDCREILPTLGKVDSVVTDPPYGVNIGEHKASTDERMKHLNRGGYISYADTPENYSIVVVPAINEALSITKRGMVFGVPPAIWQLPPPDVMGGVYLPHSVGRNRWGFSSMAHCLMCGNAAAMQHGCKATAFYNTDTAEKNGHPTPKPLSWMKWAISLGSERGETILDPFMGSGTTGVAAVKLGRKFIGIEIEPRYFDIACRRIQAALDAPDLFVERPKPAEQQKLGL
jgi:DNA modification methylase